VCSLQVFQCLADSFLQWLFPGEELFNQVNNHFRISFRMKLHPLCFQVCLEFQIIFNNPIMDHNYFSGISNMGMRIPGSRLAMSCPACVPYSNGSLNGLVLNKRLQLAQFSRFPANLHVAIGKNCNSSGIIAPIFQSS